VRRVVTSHIGTNPETQQHMLAGELDVELVPQGTLAERIRAGGHRPRRCAHTDRRGYPVEQGKRTVEIDGRSFLLEMPLRAQFALVNARRADHIGNLTYAMTARNFNLSFPKNHRATGQNGRSRRITLPIARSGDGGRRVPETRPLWYANTRSRDRRHE
jgi:acyl CoA:acetate/3-ketoacid CoA transferase alpha subunit